MSFLRQPEQLSARVPAACGGAGDDVERASDEGSGVRAAPLARAADARSWRAPAAASVVIRVVSAVSVVSVVVIVSNSTACTPVSSFLQIN